LPPTATLTDADAYISDTNPDDAADLLDALIARGGGDPGPYAYGYDRETHDARILIDGALLRRISLLWPW
jgi:hypothetical protein